MRSYSPRDHLACIVIAIIALLTFTSLASAQSTASIEGQVIDQNGAVVPGAQITLSSSAIGVIRQTVSDGVGRGATFYLEIPK